MSKIRVNLILILLCCVCYGTNGSPSQEKLQEASIELNKPLISEELAVQDFELDPTNTNLSPLEKERFLTDWLYSWWYGYNYNQPYPFPDTMPEDIPLPEHEFFDYVCDWNFVPALNNYVDHCFYVYH